MNAVVNAIQNIRNHIPLEILNLAFTDPRSYNMESLDERILSNVIRHRVLVDCNVVGGVTTTLKIKQGTINYHSQDGFVVYFPKTTTNNKSIISATSLISSQHIHTSSTLAFSGGVFQQGMKMVENMSTHGIILSSKLEIIGENTIFVHENLPNLDSLTLKVTLENDINMTNINNRSFLDFSTLCILATKAYIYNKMIINLDKGYLHTGHELGMVKQIIDSYETGNEEYLDFLKNTWMAVAFMNNSKDMNDFVTNMFNNNI